MSHCGGQIDWILVGLISIDVLVLVAWVCIDALDRKLVPLQLEDPDDNKKDIKIRPIMEHCNSEHQNIWLAVVYGYKGLLLIFGLFLAYETRSMKDLTETLKMPSNRITNIYIFGKMSRV